MTFAQPALLFIKTKAAMDLIVEVVDGARGHATCMKPFWSLRAHTGDVMRQVLVQPFKREDLPASHLLFFGTPY